MECEYGNIKEVLSSPKDVVILSHRNPDGDALGSALAMKGMMEKLGHVVHVILPNEYNTSFDWMPGINEVIIHDNSKTRAFEVFHNAALFIVLDLNALERMDPMDTWFRKYERPILWIDHHLDPDPFADYTLWDTSASSTCELVYQFFSDMQWLDKADQEIYTAIYTGLLTDTGSFRYNTSPETLRIAANILEKGIDGFHMQDIIFNSVSRAQFDLMRYTLSERLEFVSGGKAAIMYLDKNDFKTLNITRGQTEGLVNYPLSIKETQISVLVREQHPYIRISFRSKGSISVQSLARDHFHGGGHKNASGGMSRKSLEKTLEKLKELLPQYLS